MERRASRGAVLCRQRDSILPWILARLPCGRSRFENGAGMAWSSGVLSAAWHGGRVVLVGRAGILAARPAGRGCWGRGQLPPADCVLVRAAGSCRHLPVLHSWNRACLLYT